MSNQPKVFISYSWTNDDYKETVLQLAKTLTNYGVDVILDRWDLHPGHDKYVFMEQSIVSADYVLVLCDKKYTEKANSREGGVGTETAIITPDIYGKSKQEKFIPVVMEDFKYIPTYLKGRLAINFMEMNRTQGLEDILRVIYNQPIEEKPSLGTPPNWVKKKVDTIDPHNCTSQTDLHMTTKEDKRITGETRQLDGENNPNIFNDNAHEEDAIGIHMDKTQIDNRTVQKREDKSDAVKPRQFGSGICKQKDSDKKFEAKENTQTNDEEVNFTGSQETIASYNGINEVSQNQKCFGKIFEYYGDTIGNDGDMLIPVEFVLFE